jgi:hypothetical protein
MHSNEMLHSWTEYLMYINTHQFILRGTLCSKQVASSSSTIDQLDNKILSYHNIGIK